jgi:metallo-beta-lactamase class B
MFGRVLLACFALAACATSPATPEPAQDSADRMAWAEACGDWDEWDKPGPPFRIFGNTYFVGTCGISAILIVGDNGHVLIDTGTPQGAKLVAANVSSLHIELRKVELLLSSHEHFDHVGGMARMQELTGASIMASWPAASVLTTGKDSPSDPQFGMNSPIPVARLGGAITPRNPDTPGDYVMDLRLGSIVLNPIATPGHTPGALSWQWESCESNICKTIVYADSLSPVSSDSYRFSDHPDYVAAYRRGVAQLAGLECDILLTPHPSASGMRDKLDAGDLTAGPTCRAYAASISERLDARLAREAAGE